MMARYPLWGFCGLPWFVVIFICVDSRYNGATSSKVPLELGPSQSEAGDEIPLEGAGSWKPASEGAEADEEDFATAVAAASHCAALYATGQFPAHQSLGVFELGSTIISTNTQAMGGFMVTAGHVKFIFERQKAHVGVENEKMELSSSSAGSNNGFADSSPGVVTVEILLEVPLQAISARTAAAAAVAAAAATVKSQGGFGQNHETKRLRLSQPNAVDYTEYEHLALRELVTASNWEAGRPTVRVGVVAAYGNHGNIEAGQALVPLTRSDKVMTALQIPHDAYPDESATTVAEEISNSVESTMNLRGSFDWTPEAEIWTALVGGTAVVADVKISDAHDVDDYFNSSPLLLHATLCKHGTEGRKSATLAARSVVEFRATLSPFKTQRDCARRPSTDAVGCDTQPSPENTCASKCDPPPEEVVLTELADPAWTVEKGRGLNAVLALPRRLDWKPGQWREQRLKRQRQHELQERRRARESAYRKTRGKQGREGSGNRGSSGGDGNVICRFVARTLDAVKGKWRKFRRRQRRRIKS